MYYFIVTDYLMCVSDTFYYNVTFVTTDIQEFTIKDLFVYPNPSNDIFNITFTTETIQKELKVSVLNVIGEAVITESLEQFFGKYTKQINLNEDAKGIYFLEIKTNKGIINKKLILQ